MKSSFRYFLSFRLALAFKEKQGLYPGYGRMGMQNEWYDMTTTLLELAPTIDLYAFSLTATDMARP